MPDDFEVWANESGSLFLEPDGKVEATADPVFRACRLGDLEAVARYLEAGGSVRASHPELGTLPGISLARGHSGIVELLIRQGWNPNEPMGETGETPAHFAAAGRQNAILKAVLEAGADANARDKYQSTPLMRASGANNVEGVSLLISFGANLDARDQSGRSAMHDAAGSDAPDCLAVLHSAGALIEVLDQQKRTPLILAAQAGCTRSVAWLMKAGARRDAVDSGGRTAEQWAAVNGRKAVIEILRNH